MKKLPERPALIIIALISWLGVLLQYYVLWEKPVLSEMNAVQLTLLFLDYFTILTNLIVAISTTISLLASNTVLGRFFSGTSVRSAVALYITLVGIIFNVVLRSI